jgi:hypothetical protein
MALKLDKNPNEVHDYDGGQPGWLRPDMKGFEDSYNGASATDTDLPENHPSRSDNKSFNNNELKAAEETTSPKDSESTSPWETNVEKPATKKRWRGSFSRKRAAIASTVTGLIVGIIVAISSIVPGILQFSHLSQLMQRFHLARTQDLVDDGGSSLIRYVRRHDLSIQDRRIGRTMSKVAAGYNQKLAQAGLEPVYRNGIFEGIRVTNPDAGGMKELRALGYEARTGPDGRPIFEANQRSRFFQNSSRRHLIGAAYRASGIHGIAGAVGKRVEIRRAGVSMKLLGNIRSRTNETELRYRERIRSSFNEHIRKGGNVTPHVRFNEEPRAEDGSRQPHQADAETGNRELTQAIEDGRSAPGGSQAQYNAARESLRSKLNGSNKFLLGGAALCVAKQLGDSFDLHLYENVILPGIRLATSAISIGDQVRSPLKVDFNAIELGVHSERFYDNVDKTSWASARGIQAESGDPQTGPDIPDYARPTQKNNQVLEYISGIPGLGGVCGVIGNRLVGIVLSVGSSSTGLGAIGNLLFDETASRFLLPRLIDFLAGYFILGGIADGIAGASFGSVVNVYSRVAANDHAISMAGVELDEVEETAWRKERRLQERIEIANMSFGDRLFNVYDSRSLAARAVMNSPAGGRVSLQNIARLPTTIMSSLTTTLSRPFVGKVIADEPYDYGFNLFGFHQEDLDNPTYDDPYENEDILNRLLAENHQREQDCARRTRPPFRWATCERGYSSLRELNTGDSDFTSSDGDPKDSIGSDFDANGIQCFGTEIMPDGSLKYHDTVKFYDLHDDCKQRYDENEQDYAKRLNKEIWMRYRFNILHLSAEAAAACYEGDERSCRQIGMSTSSDSEAPAGIAVDGFVFPLAVKKSEVANRGIFEDGVTQNYGGHGNYIAYDILAGIGTPVLSFVDGTVVRLGGDRCGVGSVVIYNQERNLTVTHLHIKQSDGLKTGDAVSAGQVIGAIGQGVGDAGCRTPHLHIDAVSGTSRPSCSRLSCNNSDAFVDIGPQLYQTFQTLED